MYTGRGHETPARVCRMPQVLCALCAYMLVILAFQSAEALIFGQVPLKIFPAPGQACVAYGACGRRNKRVSSVPASSRKGTVGTLGMRPGQKDKGGNREEKHALGWKEVQELAPGELKTTWRRAVGEIKHAQRQQVAPWVARSESRRITADLMDMLRSEENQGNTDSYQLYSRVSLLMCAFLLCESVFTYKMIQSLRVTISFLSLLESYHLRRNYDCATHTLLELFSPASFLICSCALLPGNDSVHEQHVLEPTLMSCALRARLIRSTSA